MRHPLPIPLTPLLLVKLGPLRWISLGRVSKNIFFLGLIVHILGLVLLVFEQMACAASDSDGKRAGFVIRKGSDRPISSFFNNRNFFFDFWNVCEHISDP